MQLEKEKKEKQERERCRALAQRIAEEAAAASAALLGEQSLLLTKALRRAGVAAEAWAEGSEAELLIVVDPAYETLPEKLPARVLLVSSESTVMAGWAEQLAQRGYFPVEDLKTLRHTGSYLQGHPDMKHIPGVDMSSGSLGQGISAAVGMAIAGKLDNADYRVYTLLGDGEIQEGQVWEAAMLAAHKKLDNLVVIVDNNNLQIDGAIDEVNSPYPIDKKFEAFNFHVINIDGNDFDQIDAAFKEAKTVKGCPTAIIAKTIKGKDVSFMENQAGWHGKAPNDEEYAVAMADLEKVGEALCQM